MSWQNAFDIVTFAISNQFNVSSDDLTADTVADDIPGWDSFSNGLVIMAIEGRLGRQVEFDEISSAANVGAMAEVVSRYL